MEGVEVIKSFLVGLGFGVDDKSLAKFNKSITSASLRVTALYASTKLMAAGIVKGISDVSTAFEQMGYEYHIIAPAINKALVLRRELLKSYQLAGINIRKVVKDSINLNLSLTKTRFAFEAIYKSVSSRFFERMTKYSDTFRKRIYDNMPKIQFLLEKFINAVFKASEIFDILGRRLWSVLGRVWEFLIRLDKATDGWSTKIIGAVAAWKLLNLAFLATPLGLILLGLVAILALFDDFKTWQEGGKSLFNWAPVIPVINAVTEAMSGLWEVVRSVVQLWGLLIQGFIRFLHFDLKGVWESGIASAKKFANVLSNLYSVLKMVSGAYGSFVGWAYEKLGGEAVGANIQRGVVPSVSPIGASVTSNQTNQSVNQQTTISVQGVPDARSVGNQVSSAMARQNFDLVRNLQGSVRSGGGLK